MKRHCINCGKRGLFLRLNYEMLCADCALKVQEQRTRERKEELDRRIKKEREEAERKRIQRENEYNESIKYYNLLCQTYCDCPSGYFYDQNSALYMSSITGRTIAELQKSMESHIFLIENLPTWMQHRFFSELFMKDFEVDPDDPKHWVKHRHFKIRKYTTKGLDGLSLDIATEVEGIITYSKKAVEAYEKAISEIESMAKVVLADENTDIKNALCLGYETHRITGIRHYEKNLLKLAISNPYYAFTKSVLVDYALINIDVWKYEFQTYEVKLIPEPDNQYDKNAIKVIVGGEHIGYIKAEECAHIHELLGKQCISKISCEISGGAYKRVNEHYDIERDKEVYYLDRGTKPFVASLAITVVR